MRIISKFHDYYDSVLSYGMDNSLVYVRKTEEIKIKKNVFDIERMNISSYNNIDISIYIIGFCGKVYLCFKLEDKDIYTDSNIVYAYNIEDFIKFFKLFKDKKLLDYFLNNKDNSKSYFIWKELNQIFIKDLIKTHNSSDKYSELFFKYNTPVFIKKVNGFFHNEDHNVLIINPSLKEFEFYKLFDPFTAFQEISMFLGGVLGIGQPKLVNISNECMIEKKGFDKKWSFRKEPTKKKLK